MSTVFVTGPTGCIGAATVRYLLQQGVERVVGLSRKGDLSRIDERLRDRLTIVRGDITDQGVVRQIIADYKPTAIIHLAAFQTPDCDAQPMLGMQVNVGGTMAVLQAAAESAGSLRRVVFASSAAVYGPRSLYPGAAVTTTDAFSPPNLYGFWKVAGEGIAQAFYRETGVATVCLRLATTYGPGRDRGLTAAPTAAVKAVAAGRAFRMPYQGREHYHYVEDVGAGFGQAAIEPFGGFAAFNLRGSTVEAAEFLDILRQAAADAGIAGPVDLGMQPDAVTNLFVYDLNDALTQQAFPKMPLTPLRDGIASSLAYFRRQLDG